MIELVYFAIFYVLCCFIVIWRLIKGPTVPDRVVAGDCVDVLTDVVVLLCGLFMLYSGGARTIKLFGLPGVLPITGISTAWQYLPIPVAGFVMSFDSILFLTGIISRDDLLYSEPEVDFTDEAAVAAMTKEAEKK